MIIYVGKVTDQTFAENTSYFEEIIIIADTDFDNVKNQVASDKRCEIFGGGIEVWENGKKIKEIDLW